MNQSTVCRTSAYAFLKYLFQSNRPQAARQARLARQLCQYGSDRASRDAVALPGRRRIARALHRGDYETCAVYNSHAESIPVVLVSHASVLSRLWRCEAENLTTKHRLAKKASEPRTGPRVCMLQLNLHTYDMPLARHAAEA